MSEWGSTDPLGLGGDFGAFQDSQSSFDPGQAGATGNPTGLPNELLPQAMSSFQTDAQQPAAAPSLIQQLQALLGMGGATGAGAGGTGGGMTGLLGAGGGAIGKLLSGLLGPSFGLNQSTAGTEGGTVGELGGAAAGSLLGPLGTAGGAAIGDLLGNLVGNWVGGGVPQMAKPEAAVQGLENNQNPIEQMLGKYIQNYGINQGYDLSGSSSQPFDWKREADVLQLLGGTALPANIYAGGQGIKNPVDLMGFKNLTQLQQMSPNMTQLNANQMNQIGPLIAHLVNQSGHESLGSLLGQENSLATKLKQAETW